MHRIEFSVGDFLTGSKDYYYYTIAERVMLELCEQLEANCYLVYWLSDEPDADYKEIVLFRDDREYVVRHRDSEYRFSNYNKALQTFYSLIDDIVVYPIYWEASNSLITAELRYAWERKGEQ